MSFARIFDQLPPRESPLLRRFESLLAPNNDEQFEAVAQEAREITRQNFGRTMRMFAPLYLSNECINNCRYCGFSRDNPILRVTLDRRAGACGSASSCGARFSPGAACRGRASEICPAAIISPNASARSRPIFSSIALELGPMETAEYRAARRGGRGGSGGLPGDLRSRSLRGNAYRPGRNAILTGGSIVRSALTPRAFVASESARSLVSRRGVTKRSRSRRISNIC